MPIIELTIRNILDMNQCFHLKTPATSVLLVWLPSIFNTSQLFITSSKSSQLRNSIYFPFLWTLSSQSKISCIVTCISLNHRKICTNIKEIPKQLRKKRGPKPINRPDYRPIYLLTQSWNCIKNLYSDITVGPWCGWQCC